MGQDGAYLAKFLLSKKYKVYGAYRRNSNYENNRLRKLGIEDKIELIDLDNNKVIIKISKKFYRTLDVNHLKSNPLKAKKLLNWTSKTSLNTIIKKMCDDQISSIN